MNQQDAINALYGALKAANAALGAAYDAGVEEPEPIEAAMADAESTLDDTRWLVSENAR